jgi:hypothetical protein
MDFQSESNGSDISYLLDISMSLSLSDDDDEGNTIARAERPAIYRAAVSQVADLAVASLLTTLASYGIFHNGAAFWQESQIRLDKPQC